MIASANSTMCSLFPVSYCMFLAFLVNKTRDKQQETENKKHIVELALQLKHAIASRIHCYRFKLEHVAIHISLLVFRVATGILRQDDAIYLFTNFLKR